MDDNISIFGVFGMFDIRAIINWHVRYYRNKTGKVVGDLAVSGQKDVQ